MQREYLFNACVEDALSTPSILLRREKRRFPAVDFVSYVAPLFLQKEGPVFIENREELDPLRYLYQAVVFHRHVYLVVVGRGIRQ